VAALLAAGIAFGVLASSASAHERMLIEHHRTATYLNSGCEITFVHGNYGGAYAGARPMTGACSLQHSWVQAVGLVGPYHFRYGPRCTLAMSAAIPAGCTRVSTPGSRSYWTRSAVSGLPIVISRLHLCASRHDCDRFVIRGA
jgi:hypothetical protein